MSVDINTSINNLSQIAQSTAVDSLLNLKIGQTLDVTVISATIKAEENAIVLKLGNKLITLQSNFPVQIDPGQALQIQVTKTTPILELKLLGILPQSNSQTVLLSLQKQPEHVFKTNIKVEDRLETIPVKQHAGKSPLQSFALRQQLLTKIIGLVGDKIQLQILPSRHEKTVEPPPIQIDRTQLLTGTSQPLKALQIGQLLKLEVTKPGLAPTFKALPVTNTDLAEKITALVKQVLPKHQSATGLLNQLIKDTPLLLNHRGLSQDLKDSVITMLGNLPQKQQLLSSPGIKQAVGDSGLFLEAKLGQLTSEELKTDFKAGLLKLMLFLQQEVDAQTISKQQEVDLEWLKTMQQKTENTLARVILDQLISLPKDDTSKQVWHLELPFVDRENTDSVKLEIQQDHDNSSHPDSGNWSVQITISPPGLGTIHCTISYRNQVINTHFCSQKIQTTALIRRNLDYLKEQFERSGLTTGIMNAHDGMPITRTVQPIDDTKLFDDKA
jgi:hypothetical protein